jgi:hypothetical protein
MLNFSSPVLNSVDVVFCVFYVVVVMLLPVMGHQVRNPGLLPERISIFNQTPIKLCSDGLAGLNSIPSYPSLKWHRLLKSASDARTTACSAP